MWTWLTIIGPSLQYFYKFISKILKNRLKRVLPRIISPSGVFTQGRDIRDNIFAAYEIRNNFSKKEKRNKQGFIAVIYEQNK